VTRPNVPRGVDRRLSGTLEFGVDMIDPDERLVPFANGEPEDDRFACPATRSGSSALAPDRSAVGFCSHHTNRHFECHKGLRRARIPDEARPIVRGMAPRRGVIARVPLILLVGFRIATVKPTDGLCGAPLPSAP
jgi:hypothetical protein